MNNFSRPAPSNFHSLVDWLVLSGVSFEVGNQSYYEASTALKAELSADIPAPQAGETIRSANTISKAKTAVPASAGIIIPEFNSLEELNSFYKNFRDLGLCRMASCVIGQGNPAPQIMVIADAPEDQEDRSGVAFSGLSNQMIVKALGFSGIDQDNIYYTYLSKWRPPGKRLLTPQETEICTQLLYKEISLLRPKAILSLGESTVKAIWPDSLMNGNKIPFINSYKNHTLDYEMPFMASQKSEFLVKNALMKKSFWFSLLDFAATIRT